MFWEEKFHGDLEMDDNDLLNNLYEATQEEIENISISNLSSSLGLLREFKRDDLADNLIDLFLNIHKDEPIQFYVLNPHEFYDFNALDKKLISKFENKFLNFPDNRNIKTIIEKINNDGPDAADYLTLSRFKEEDYISFIMQTKGKDLYKVIDTLLTLRGRSSKYAQEAFKIVHGSLLKIASMSKLKASRLKRFDINLSV